MDEIYQGINILVKHDAYFEDYASAAEKLKSCQDIDETDIKKLSHEHNKNYGIIKGAILVAHCCTEAIQWVSDNSIVPTKNNLIDLKRSIEKSSDYCMSAENKLCRVATGIRVLILKIKNWE